MFENKNANIIEEPANSVMDVETRINRRAARRNATTARMRRSMVRVLLAASVIMVALVAAFATPTTEQESASTENQPPVLVIYQTGKPEWEISDQDKETVELAVMGSARGESLLCMKAVAQTIRHTCEDEKLTVDEVIAKYQYPIWECSISDEATEAVEAVISGEEVIADRLHCFYNPKVDTGSWHETQEYVFTIGDVRFFK